MKANVTDILGIMSCETKGTMPFPEKNFYRRLSMAGDRNGLQVVVFSPHRIDWNINKVVGYAYDKKTGEWNKAFYPLPRLVYDRCFYNSREQLQEQRTHISRLKKTRNIQFLGNGMNGKWNVQQSMMKSSLFLPHLPNTLLFNHINEIIHWLTQKQEVFLKPQGGSQGKGICHVVSHSSRYYTIQGRDRKNKPFKYEFNGVSGLLRWLRRFIGQRKYILQDYLSLTTKSGQAFDIRSLVQKNGNGLWHHTGIAIRCGKVGSITSNLHGGGEAEEVGPFLQTEFGEQKAQQIIDTIKELSEHIPSYLEQYYGRLLELGIDYGVDHQGKVWILEVNSKPGRTAFQYIHPAHHKSTSIRNPIQYARYLLNQQLGG